MSIFTLARLKNQKVSHIHPHFTMYMSKIRLQLKINHFFLKLLCLFQLFTLELQSECVANLRTKTQVLFRQTGVDSDFTQNF